jgi:FixJ family two-component response regulator
MSLHQFLVAVVDDDYRVLESLDEMLTAAGHQVLLFASGTKFLEAECTQQIDCLISDVGMPRMSGWQLMQIARAQRPDLPVILITGRDEEQFSFSEQDSNYYFLRKPFDGRELLNALKTLVRNDS